MTTLLDRATDELDRAARALGHDAGEATATLRALVSPCAWARRDEAAPRLPSGISHRWPYSLSTVCSAGARADSGHGELRVFLEAQAARDRARDYWDVGMAMCAWIGARPRASLERLHLVAPLFVPDQRAPLRIWHSARWIPGDPTPRYHVYLSARADPERAPEETVSRALERLELRAAGRRVARALTEVDGRGAFTLLSLDLLDAADARTKVYALLRGASWRDVARIWALTGADTARARSFVTALAPGGRRDWLCACTLRGEAITRVALHAALGPADAAIVESCGRALDLDLAPYLALREVQPRHHFISYQRWDDRPRLTVYMAPETRG